MDFPFDHNTARHLFIQDVKADPVTGHLAHRINEPMAQHILFDSVFKYSQFYETDEGFFSYNIREPYTQNIRRHYLLQEDSQFDEAWYNACDDYIMGLSLRDKYILRRYKRHGDEIVNALLRQPDTFATNKRVQTLFFETMPDENQMLYAMQSIYKYASGNNESYVTSEWDLNSVEYRELQEMEMEEFGSLQELEMPVILERIKPFIYMYIEDLRQILRQAPPLPRSLQVFRATGTDYLNNPYESAVVHGFVSTSMDSCIGEAFPQNNFIYQLILQPGVPCLSIKKASKYPSEFEVLVDTGCFVNSSLLVGKHTLQTDIYSGEVDPEHILIEPQNLQHRIRIIQVISQGHAGGRATLRISTSKSRRLRRLRHSKSQGPRSKKSKTRRSGRPSKRHHTRLMTWKNRDLLPPRIEYGKVPVAIHKPLLEAHKKMGTDFHNIAR